MLNVTNIQRLINSKSIEENLIISIEELSELQKELCKRLRGYTNKQEIVEETADVLISLCIIRAVIGISDEELKAECDKKMKRNLDRIKE